MNAQADQLYNEVAVLLREINRDKTHSIFMGRQWRSQRRGAAVGAPPQTPGRLRRKNVAGGLRPQTPAGAPPQTPLGAPAPDRILNGDLGGAPMGSAAEPQRGSGGAAGSPPKPPFRRGY